MDDSVVQQGRILHSQSSPFSHPYRGGGDAEPGDDVDEGQAQVVRDLRRAQVVVVVLDVRHRKNEAHDGHEERAADERLEVAREHQPHAQAEQLHPVERRLLGRGQIRPGCAGPTQPAFSGISDPDHALYSIEIQIGNG